MRMLSPSLASATSAPLTVTECTFVVRASRNVEVVPCAVKVTVVVERKVSGPVVRSRSTTYDSTERTALRSWASSRVRFSPGTRQLLRLRQGGTTDCVRRQPYLGVEELTLRGRCRLLGRARQEPLAILDRRVQHRDQKRVGVVDARLRDPEGRGADD